MECVTVDDTDLGPRHSGAADFVERLPENVGSGADLFIGKRAGIEGQGAAQHLLGKSAFLFGRKVLERLQQGWVSRLMRAA